MEAIDTSLVDWSRAQFALTAMYHWLFVPLTLGLGVIMAIMETIYVRTGREFWKQTARFWMKLFGINFAMGVATGIILEFEFGTNWSNYSWFVGDIFGAPLAIEGIVAFFMESTFIAVMYFGWNKVSKRAHLASTWLTIIGATLSAWWILVANAWMQHPVGMEFNPDTVRNEMVDFAAVAFSPVAVVKFCHTVASSWVLGAVFVVGLSCWYLLRKRHQEFAHASIKVAAWFGLVAALITAHTGHQSGRDIAVHQPMKLAAAEGLYEGGTEQGLVLGGLLRPGAVWAQPSEESKFLFHVEMPYALSLLATHEVDGYVPGIRNLLEGGYPLPEGGEALSAEEKMARGRVAIAALAEYRTAKDEATRAAALSTLRENFAYFGYGYLEKPADLVPNVPLTFYSFRIMVVLGGYFILLFAGLLLLGRRVEKWKLVQWGVVLTIPLAWLASQAGWVVAEVGRQPWAIQGLLPNVAAISRLGVSSVQTTFFIFLVLFTLLLVAELSIMGKAIAAGPETESDAA
ncbi:MAG: cytochrome ubiquinol oxidase subunit I [Akkermansia sp.]|nr:cytochrome ubiquinol oxidase subunit I [Akkermansia sp.]